MQHRAQNAVELRADRVREGREGRVLWHAQGQKGGAGAISCGPEEKWPDARPGPTRCTDWQRLNDELN